MKFLLKNHLFENQNSIFKLIVILVGIVIASFANFSSLSIISLFTIIYFIFSPKIYLYWLKTIIKILPFFTSYLFFGIIFKISFIVQCMITIRIIFILLFSIYLISTTSIESFLTDASFLMKHKFGIDIILFIVATIYFIPVFINNSKKNSSTKNVIQILSTIISCSFLEIKNVEKESLNMINKKYKKIEFWNLANLYLMTLFTLYILVISL